MGGGRAESTGAELSSVAGSLKISASGRGGSTANPDRTQTVTESQRRWRARQRLGLDTLAVPAEWFPLFRPPTFRPLKLKIHLDLIERAPVTAEEVDAALSIHCRSLSYLRAQVEGADRVDLDGNPAAADTAEEAANAKARIAAIRLRGTQGQANRSPPAAVCRSWRTIAPKATKPATRQPGRPAIDLSGRWKGWRHERDDRLREA